MTFAVRDPLPKGASRVIAGLAVLFLGAIAFAIPPAPIEIRVKERRGYVESFSRFSDRLADLLAGDGYSFLALELQGAPGGEAAFWKEQLERVQKRRFKVWGWLPASMELARARELVLMLQLEGLLVYGPGSGTTAASAASWKPGLKVLEVVDEKDPRAADAACVAVSPEGFAAAGDRPAGASATGRAPMRVLKASSLTALQLRELRAKATGDYVIWR
ncbi:MAG: hypothetical protein ACT4PV_05670 [Planctomycetaceae bacterium]